MELIAEIREANAALQSEIEHQDRLLQDLENERIAAAKAVPLGGPTESDLLETPSPRALAQLALARHNARSAEEKLSLMRDPILNITTNEISSQENLVQQAQFAARKAYCAATDE